MADGGASACEPIPVPAGANRSDSRAAHPHGGENEGARIMATLYGLFRRGRVLGGLVLLTVMPGCAALFGGMPPSPPALKPPSTALAADPHTHFGRLFTPLVAAHPGQSGFSLLYNGIEALAARLLLSSRAERSIDAQYYLLHADLAGYVFVEQLLKAADRGVRVRLLLDDMTTKGHDVGLAALDAHPHLEVRIFNPFARRTARWWDVVTDLGRVNHRMHNKSMTFDNQITIVGGRNIGDRILRRPARYELQRSGSLMHWPGGAGGVSGF